MANTSAVKRNSAVLWPSPIVRASGIDTWTFAEQGIVVVKKVRDDRVGRLISSYYERNKDGGNLIKNALGNSDAARKNETHSL